MDDPGIHRSPLTRLAVGADRRNSSSQKSSLLTAKAIAISLSAGGVRQEGYFLLDTASDLPPK